MTDGDLLKPPSPAGQSWRDRIKIHPAADLFPMMPDAELRELGEDIKKNGLRQNLIFLCNRHKKTRTEYPGWEEMLLLDGRNRIAAMELVGLRLFDDETGAFDPETAVDSEDPIKVMWRDGFLDPYAYVISANIRRRHLTAEKRRELIVELVRRSR